MFGLLWSFLIPLFSLIVYTFVFSTVLKAKWSVGGESKAEFALVLFAGLLVFNLFSDCINRAPTLILNNQNYVTKVIFPLEILALVVVGAAIFQFLIGLGVLLLGFTLIFGLPPSTMFNLPLIIMPLTLLIIGISWFISSLGVYLRDINQIVFLVTTLLMFLSPIFYPVTALPNEYQKLLFLNPLTFIIEQFRVIIFLGEMPNYLGLIAYSLISLLIMFFGFIWFQKTRRGFGDVI
jgi:lipopolysaccharide transport system permease protein